MSNRWPTVRLGEVLTERQESPLPEDLISGRIKVIGKISFHNGQIETRPDCETRTGMILIRPGDLVVSGINAAKGAIALYDEAATDSVAATIHYAAYIPNRERVSVRFLWWMLRSRFFQGLLLAHVPGGIKTELKAARLLPVPIPLPPLAEQRRMVARIEELVAQIEEARKLRREVVEEAEALPGARADKLFGTFPTLSPVEELADVSGGLQKSPHRAPGANPVRYLTVAHVQRNRISTGDPRYFEVTAAELARYRLLPGDVLIIEGNGSSEQIGRTALFRGEIDACVHQNHVIRIRADQRRVLPEFLNAYLNSPVGQDAVQARSRTTSGLRTLSVGRVRAIPVPIPALNDQRRIVAELDALQREVDALNRLQAETVAELDALLPSILDRAFKGEL